MNRVFLQGNLVDDVRVFTNKDGVKVVKGVIAVVRPTKKRDSDFVPFTLMGNSVDYTSKFGKKGTRTLIQGSWYHSSFKDKDGNVKSSDCCLVEEIKFFVERPVVEDVQEEQPSDIDTDDLPF